VIFRRSFFDFLAFFGFSGLRFGDATRMSIAD